MNKAEAKAILAERLRRYRDLPYASLVERVGTVEAEEVTGPSGTRYQLEFEPIWDGSPGGDVRMLGAIDDGGIRAFVPVCEDFIKAPDGGFVDE
jgi:hypothetical protein